MSPRCVYTFYTKKQPTSKQAILMSTNSSSNMTTGAFEISYGTGSKK